MSIGYACLNVGVNNVSYKTCTLKNATPENLYNLIKHNLTSLENVLDYNFANNIKLFRISSEIIPFASNPINTLDWRTLFKDQLSLIGEKIRQYDIRVSMHIGHYSVLNSPSEIVLKNTIKDFQYHADFLNSLNIPVFHKLIVHIGGVYGDKQTAIKRFIDNYIQLDSSIKDRLVIENDDRSYNINDVLQISKVINIPVVFDNLHNHIINYDETKSDYYWISKCNNTWKQIDGKQKIHYSQQNPLKNIGAHSTTIDVLEFLTFHLGLEDKNIDIMLEVKDKNVSALKTINTTLYNEKAELIELEWNRYKYLIFEKNPDAFALIENKINNSNNFTALEFYKLIQSSLKKEATLENFINASFKVFDSFEGIINEKEKVKFLMVIKKIKENKLKTSSIKTYLNRLAIEYQREDLLNSYYFDLQ